MEDENPTTYIQKVEQRHQDHPEEAGEPKANEAVPLLKKKRSVERSQQTRGASEKMKNLKILQRN